MKKRRDTYAKKTLLSAQTQASLPPHLSPSSSASFVFKFIRSVKGARWIKSVSQQELATMIKTSQSSIARFEAGDNMNPTIGFLCDMAQALGLKIEIRPVLRKPLKSGDTMIL
jgi:ribosome-binding protein aMBF1 (putative translation factor)